MKKYFAIVIICALLLGLCACSRMADGDAKIKLELFDKYERYIRLLEEENYEQLLDEIRTLYENQQGGAVLDGPQLPVPEEPNISPAPGGDADTNGPTASEQEVLDAYAQIYSGLQNTLRPWKDEQTGISYSGEAARTLWNAKYYSQLRSMDLSVIDKWLGTQYLAEDVDWDYQHLLSCFEVLEDMPLFQISTYCDRMGNEERDIYAWIYEETGLIRCESYFTNKGKFEMIPTDPMNLLDTFSEYAEYTCDADGKPVQIKYFKSTGETVYLVDVTYDDSGNKIKETVHCNSGEADILYAYDEQNRLIELSYQDSINIYNNYREYVITYTYDERGNLLRSHKTERYYGTIQGYETIVYTYDDSGKLVSGVRTVENLWNKILDTVTEDHYTFRCDDQGRVLFMNTEFGDSYYADGSPNGAGGQVASNATRVSGSREFIYGDFVLFSIDE